MRRLALLVVALAFIPAASAHVPLVDATDRHIDASGSWAYFETLHPGEVDTWTFDLEAGDRIFLLVAVPVDDPWRPDATLSGPRGPLALERVDRIGFEPATPYASRETWTLDATAPDTGTYELTIQGEGGRYVLGSGLTERFSVLEWASIPLAVERIHLWQGQPAWLLVLPFATALAAAGLLALRAGVDLPISRAASALYLGTALERALQLAIATAQGASPGAFGMVFTGLTIVAPLALGLALWRARRPLTLLVLATLGIAAWAGLLVGPALAAGGGVLGARNRRLAGKPA